MAKHTARATATGSSPNSRMSAWIHSRADGSIPSASSVLTKPGEISVVRTTPSVDSVRRPAMIVRAAFFVAA
jgi:hypothetical protein